MKVLGIMGSPRKGGNSDRLLEQALAGAREAGAEVSSVRAAEVKAAGCRGCDGCTRTGECVIQDGMQTIYPLFDAADRIILSSPMYFYSFPSQLKAVMDRAQAHWSRRMLRKSPDERLQYDAGLGYLIAVGATKGKRLFDGAELSAQYFFDALDMRYAGGLFFRGLDGPHAVRDQPDALKQAWELGRQAAGGDDSAHPLGTS